MIADFIVEVGHLDHLGNAEKIHPWIFSARLNKAHVRDGRRKSTTERVVRVGASCPKREALNDSALPLLARLLGARRLDDVLTFDIHRI
jgi:hypothetical protein